MKLNNAKFEQTGFTLVEVSIVLLIVTILLGYTIAMFPVQQELKQYRQAQEEIREIKQALIGFAQINGRLPCPAAADSAGVEDAGGTGCNAYTGFVPAITLGIRGDLNDDLLLMDPWGNPYRYAVASSDFDGDAIDDFVSPDEMKDIGLVDSNADDAIDLDANLVVCRSASTDTDECSNGDYLIGDPDTTLTPPVYLGAPAVILSMGKNWSSTPSGEELENAGSTLVTGSSGTQYRLDTDTVFARPNGQREDFDDLVDWVSSNLLFSKMIEAGQLP